MNKFIKNSDLANYSLSMTVFCLPMVVFCLLVSWGIEALAEELIRLG